MALDPTLQETLLKLSVRKYFVDSIETARGIKIFFDREYHIPTVNGTELTNWLMFHFGRIRIDILSSAVLQVNCFTRKDPDSVQLSVIRDALMDVLFDHEATDGLYKIPYLNDQRIKIGGIVPLVQDESEVGTTVDGSNVKSIMLKLNWGTK